MNGPQTIDQDETSPAPDVESILAIHREPGGYVGFVRKPDPAHPRLDRKGQPYHFENLFSIRVSDLRAMFPSLANWLTHDSYFTVHAYHRPAPYLNQATGLPDVWRKEKYLSKLTACYADLDCGRPESEDPIERLSWAQALGEAETLMEADVIPQASIMARSGQGLYLFWLLRDVKEPTKLPHAWPEKVELYKSINRALNERLRTHNLPADRKAIDAARVLRVPGSVSRKVNRRVRYWIRADDQGKGFVYTLPELAEFLNLPALTSDLPDKTRALARPARYRKVKNPGSAPLRSYGSKTLHALRAQDLLTIQTWRGGFLKRCMRHPNGDTSPGRRFILSLYLNFIHGSGVDQVAALAALRSMAASMKPPYPSDGPQDDPPLETLVEAEYSTGKRRRWSNKKLCHLLGISAGVARELALKTIRPPDLAAEADQARPHQSDIVADRREFVRQYVEAHGVPTARKLARVLHAAGWITSPNNQTTPNQDLNSLGFIVVRSPGGRPRKGTPRDEAH